MSDDAPTPGRDVDHEAIVETIGDAVFVVDDDRELAYANEAALRRADASLADVRGTPVTSLAEEMVAGDAGAFEAALDAVFEDEGGFPRTVVLELDLPTWEGFAEYRLSPQYRGDEVARAIVVARDVTERAEREATRERRDRQLNRLHEVTRELVAAETPAEAARLVSDAADDILDLPLNGVHLRDEATDRLVPTAVSDRAAELLGEPPALDEGLAWQAFRAGEVRVYDDLREEDANDPETPVRSEMYLPLGEYGVLLVSSTEVGAFDEGDIELARILAANTEAALERIDREQQLRARESELERKNERLEAFADIVSHDLRNPLNVARGRLELARADCDSDHLADVERAHERIDELTESLLTLARQGEDIEEYERVELTDLLEECWATVRTESATLAVDADRAVRADRSRLRQLVENLIRNAVEHGGADVTVTVGDMEGGFYVADDGPGIPETEREAVFERGQSGTADSLGLGLFIVEEIATAHGWTVGVTEGEAGGARFEFTGVEFVD